LFFGAVLVNRRRGHSETERVPFPPVDGTGGEELRFDDRLERGIEAASAVADAEVHDREAGVETGVTQVRVRGAAGGVRAQQRVDLGGKSCVRHPP